MTASTSAGAVSASVQGEHRDGTIFEVFLLVTLPSGMCGWHAFDPIVSAIRTATQSKHAMWRTDCSRMFISVDSPDPASDEAERMVYNAVIRGISGVVSPSTAINWQRRR